MKLTITRSANSVCYYVSESFRKPNGVSSTRTIMKLGNEQYLREKLGEGVDIKEWCKEQVRIMTENQKAGKPSPVTVTLIPDEPYEKDEKREFNVGYFILKQQLNKLNFSKLCKEISDKQKFQYNFEQIFSDLICTRILEPTSKLSSFEYANEHFLKKPEYALSDVYRALDVIADNDEFIQSFLYQTSATSNPDVKRNTDVFFYDCTNFFFESNDSGELRRYGKSKENRPNLIVQMGLFMDGNGIPLGYSIFPDNQNEQPSLKPLEQRIINDFNLSNKNNIIICTDENLASLANRRFSESLKCHFNTSCSNISKNKLSIAEIDSINKGRKEIDDLFRIMKTEFSSRSESVTTNKHIKAHFNTCFVALLVVKLLEHTILQHGNEHYTIKNIVKTLRDMKITKMKKYYTGSFTRTDLTDVIHEISETRFDCDILQPKTIEKYLKKFS